MKKMRGAILSLVAVSCLGVTLAPYSVAAESSMKIAQEHFRSGQYFRAARYAFAAKEENPAIEAEAYSWITMSLVKAGLYNSASYFFIRTLQTGNRPAIRRVLGDTETLLVRVGGDVLRKYLVRHTQYEDYDSVERSAYLYSLGKEAILAGQEDKAVGYLNGVDSRSRIWPFALQLRGSAFAILGKNDHAIADFETCISKAGNYVNPDETDPKRIRLMEREADDLRARCRAGLGRTLYQMDRFEDADVEYDRIAKSSLVWPDILFEQAWNSFARKEYNRTLGKLVSYKSPALTFVYNPEVDVLRAQTFLALCQYSEANEIVNEFNGKYSKVGEEVKRLVESKSDDLPAFYRLGKEALRGSLYSSNGANQMMNRFVRGPYFQNLVQAETDIIAEEAAIDRFGSVVPGATTDGSRGFPGFAKQVLTWRLKSIQLLGGAFVKNSLMDHHAALISDFEKMAFIKLEMLKRSKDQLVFKNRPAKGGATDRNVGNVKPHRADYQYYWGFNGEFWNDELGDYVFGLESQCKGGENGGA